MTGILGLDADDLNTCVACGLCLPHCPTYRVTGREVASPRGRIAAMRLVDSGELSADATFVEAMESCVGCRGCEPACPSAVPFGRLMTATRSALPRPASWFRRFAEWFALDIVLPRHRLLILLTRLLAVLQRLRLVPRRLGIPRLAPAGRRPLRLPVGGAPEAWLFTGCVMDAWLRDVHRAAARVMDATGTEVAVPGPGGACCGALHLHAGRREEARRLARRVIASMPGAAPVVVDSAGCGAVMKEYGDLLGTDEAHRFSARVRDFSEWMVATGLPVFRSTGQTVVVQDPCHLRNVQRTHGAVRELLAGAYSLVETADDGLCCGAGGAFAVFRADDAAAIRARKVAALRAAAGDADPIVVSANPGCVMHLRAAGLDVRHPAELAAEVLE